jgi:hypothetical protein
MRAKGIVTANPWHRVERGGHIADTRVARMILSQAAVSTQASDSAAFCWSG